MPNKQLAVIGIAVCLFFIGCNRKQVPEHITAVKTSNNYTSNSTSAVKKVVVKKATSQAVPKVIAVNDKAAKKSFDGRLYYDINTNNQIHQDIDMSYTYDLIYYPDLRLSWLIYSPVYEAQFLFKNLTSDDFRVSYVNFNGATIVTTCYKNGDTFIRPNTFFQMGSGIKLMPLVNLVKDYSVFMLDRGNSNDSQLSLGHNANNNIDHEYIATVYPVFDSMIVLSDL